MTETGISIVYFGAIVLTILLSILVLLYLKGGKAFRKIWQHNTKWWRISFRTSILLAALMGTLSVSFTDCKGSYESLTKSADKTIMLGLEQIGNGMESMAFIMIFWFVLLLIASTSKKRSG